MNAAQKSHPPLHRHVAVKRGREWTPKHNRWAIAMEVTIATFMEVLDTSVANVALPHIAGALAASHSQSTWVLTSYLVSNAIILPMSAWLSVVLGRKRFYMGCVALFTISSVMCGLAPSLEMSFLSVVILRIYQAGALALLFVPINTLAYTDIPEDRNDDVSSMINLARNVGGSVGIALMTTLATRRTQFHQARLVGSVTAYDNGVRATASRMDAMLERSGAGGSHMTLAGMYRGLQAQAATLAYMDAFWAIAVLCACVAPLVFLMKKSDPSKGMIIG